MKYEIKTKKLPKSEVEIEGTIPTEELSKARDKAIKNFILSVELPGFRKGHAPEKIVLEKIGEAAIMDEAADILLREHFPLIIEQEKHDIIGRPNISITKLALGNPMEFKAKFAVMPEIKLPDYKEIAKSTSAKAPSEKEEAQEKEVDDVLLQIRKNKAHFDWHKANPDHTEHDHPNLDKEESLPALDDELAKQAGNFKNLEELKAKIRENIVSDKKTKNAEKKRGAIMEALIEKTPIDMPEILVESEIEKSLAQMKDDIARMGGKWEDYIAHIKKTEDDLKKDLRESSEKKAKIQLIFNKIAETEKLEPNKEVLEEEVKHILEHYPESSETNARIYVTTILLNQEVLKILES